MFGLGVEGVVSARDALESTLDASGLGLHDTPDGLVFRLPAVRQAVSVATDALVRADGPLVSRKRPDPSEATGRLALTYTDRERDYLDGTVTAMRLAGGALATQNTPLVLDLAGARSAAERMLRQSASLETLELTLSPSMAAVEPGDVLAVDGQGDGPFVVTALREGLARKASLVAIAPTANVAIVADRALAASGATPNALPFVLAAQLPALPSDPGRSQLLLAATAEPWPGSILIKTDDGGNKLATLTKRATIGEVMTAIGAGPNAVWDEATTLDIRLYAGHLSSSDEASVLAGSNRLAVQTDSGQWEVIGVAEAILTGPSLYRLRRLLRGQGGTGPAVGPIGAGQPLVLLDESVATVRVKPDWLGDTLLLRAYAGKNDPVGTALSVDLTTAPELPLPPVHLQARRDPACGDITFGWVRCSRTDTDSWSFAEAPLDVSPEAYLVSIRDGPTVRRTLNTATPQATYTAAQQAADWAGLPASFAFTVTQSSPLLGAGLPAQGAFP